MSALATAAAVGVSLAGIGYLAVTDPKRRRTHRQPALAGGHAGVAWAVAFLPGVLVPFASGGGGFVLWLGATATLGWLLVAMRPDRLEGLRARFGGGGGR